MSYDRTGVVHLLSPSLVYYLDVVLVLTDIVGNATCTCFVFETCLVCVTSSRFGEAKLCVTDSSSICPEVLYGWVLSHWLIRSYLCFILKSIDSDVARLKPLCVNPEWRGSPAARRTVVDPSSPFQQLPLLRPGGCPTTESPWVWEETLKPSPGPESHDMEVPTRGAPHRCASVSESFRPGNSVLFASSLFLFVGKRRNLHL